MLSRRSRATGLRMLTSEEHRLVEYACKTWADGHVKASLAVFAMLALSIRPQWVGDLQDSLWEISGKGMRPDANTLHRMMRRLDRLGLVRCVRHESGGPGAARKVFALTTVGEAALKVHLSSAWGYLSSPSFTQAWREVAPRRLPDCRCCNGRLRIGEWQ